MPPRLIVTRPEPAASRWVAALHARGLPAQALPLIHIAPAPDLPALRAARQRLPAYLAVMYVSGQAVASFLEADEKTGSSPIAQDFAAIETRAWSPGPGTTDALRRAGWPAARIDAPAADAPQFDSEALWARVQPQLQALRPQRPDARVLIVRGGDAQGRPSGRPWLAEQLHRAGIGVDEIVAYRRLPPQWNAATRARAAQAAGDGSLWLFSTAEALHNLQHALPGQNWQAARALATHPRIAQAAQAAGFGQVGTTQPTQEAVARALQALA